MRHWRHRDRTAFSKYVWSLKDKNTDFNIRWSVRRRATAYQTTTRRCNLCLAEKLEIIKAHKKRSLNKRTELVSKCRHENRFYLCNFPLAAPWTGSPPFSDFTDFPLFCFCRSFQSFEFLPAFSNLADIFKFFYPFEFFEFIPAFSDLADVFPIFDFFRFLLCIITRYSSPFRWFLMMFMVFIVFLWFLCFPSFLLQSQLHVCPPSSLHFFHPLLTS